MYRIKPKRFMTTEEALIFPSQSLIIVLTSPPSLHIQWATPNVSSCPHFSCHFKPLQTVFLSNNAFSASCSDYPHPPTAARLIFRSSSSRERLETQERSTSFSLNPSPQTLCRSYWFYPLNICKFVPFSPPLLLLTKSLLWSLQEPSCFQSFPSQWLWPSLCSFPISTSSLKPLRPLMVLSLKTSQASFPTL